MCRYLEFAKNANSDDIDTTVLILISLATIGVCFFCAAASVAAFFIFLEGISMKRKQAALRKLLCTALVFLAVAAFAAGCTPEEVEDIIDKLPLLCEHPELVETPAKAVTCTEDGNLAYWYCADCRKCFLDATATAEVSYKETRLYSEGHKEVVDAAVAPTFIATGLTEGRHCSVCKEVLVAQETISVLIPGEYAINYNELNGAQSPSLNRYNERDGVAKLPDVSREGYDFRGWFDGKGNRVSSIAPGTKDQIDLYAKWEIKKYKIHYFKAPENPNVKEYTIEDRVILEDPKWSGLMFTSWSESTGKLKITENEAGTIAEISRGTTGEIEITANWTTYENLVTPKKNGKLSAEFDPATGKYYFLYDLGMIQNVPLDQIFETYEKTTQANHTMSVSNTVSVERTKAESIAQTMLNSVTQSQQLQTTVGELNENQLDLNAKLTIGMEVGYEKICQAKFQTEFGFGASFMSQSSTETMTGKVLDESTGLEKECSSTITYAETLETTSQTAMEIPGYMPHGTYAYVHAADIRVFALITYDPLEICPE